MNNNRPGWSAAERPEFNTRHLIAQHDPLIEVQFVEVAPGEFDAYRDDDMIATITHRGAAYRVLSGREPRVRRGY